MIDFKKAEGLFDPSAKVMKYLADVPIQDIVDLPDHKSLSLKKVLSKTLNVSIDNVCIGNGSSELLISISLLQKKYKNLVVIPTYDVFFNAIDRVNGTVCLINLNESDNFEWTDETTKMIVKAIKKDKSIRTIWLCSPNNPCGTLISLKSIESILKIFDGIVIVDEAYIEYVDDYEKKTAVRLIKKYTNLIVLRTFSKMYSLAGLRIGYCVSNKIIIEKIERTNLYFNTSNISQKSAELALMDVEYIKNIKKKNVSYKTKLVNELRKINNIKIGSDTKTNLLIIKHRKKKLYKLLKSKGIITKDLSKTAGMPKGYVRLGVRDIKDNKRFINVLRRLV